MSPVRDLNGVDATAVVRPAEMDGPLAAIVDVVDKADYATIRPSTREALLGHLVDSVGCAAGGFDSEPARLAREIVRGTSAPVAASVAGVPSPVPVELAAFANTTMIRYLDYNDAGRGGHPSDMFGALLAVAEASGSSGKDLLTAVYVAYEVYECFTDAVSVRDRGWDQGVHCSLGAAAGLANCWDCRRSRPRTLSRSPSRRRSRCAWYVRASYHIGRGARPRMRCSPRPLVSVWHNSA